MNAQVRQRDCTELEKIIVPYGVDKRDKKGKDLLGVYQNNNLCIMNRFFWYPSYVTFKSSNKEK